MVIAADVDRDASQPVDEGLVGPPFRERAENAQKSFLHEIVEFGRLAGEAPKQAGELGVMAAQEAVEGRAVACLRAGGERFVAGFGRVGEVGRG